MVSITNKSKYQHVYMPIPGKASENEINRNPIEDNAWIKEINLETGRVEEIYGAGPIMRGRLQPKKPYEWKPPEEIVTDEGKKVVYEVLPEERLGRGIKWAHQLIYRHVQIFGGCTKEDIIRALTTEERVMPHTDYYESQVDEQIGEMRDRYLLRKAKEGYKIQSRMEYERPLIEFRRGYMVPLKKVEELAKGKADGKIHYDGVKRYLMDNLRIVEEAENITKIIDSLVDRGVLTETTSDWYKFQNPLRPIGG